MSKVKFMNIGGLPIVKFLLWPLRFMRLNLYAWSRFPLALLPHPTVKKGDRFMAMSDVEATGMVHYSAPFTDGFNCVIPENTILTAIHDSERISSGFGCVPENERQFEETHVPEETRKDPKYAGYSFAIKYYEIGKKFRKT